VRLLHQSAFVFTLSPFFALRPTKQKNKCKRTTPLRHLHITSTHALSPPQVEPINSSIGKGASTVQRSQMSAPVSTALPFAMLVTG
jgi:hypothetical protein